MPYEDDDARRAARERLQTRMERRGATSSSASRQTSHQVQRSRNEALRERSSSRPAKPAQTDRKSGQAASGGTRQVEIGPLSFELPASVPPIVIPLAAAIIVIILVFALIIPSCSRIAGGTESSAASPAATGASSGESGATAQASQPESISDLVISAMTKAKSDVQNARTVNSLNTQESHEAALTELLGDETSAKLLARCRSSADALWIAAHPSAFAIDGVEVQYKVLKLAADEPSAIDYVRNFPTSYPQESVNEDKSLAMSTSSPSSGVPDTSIPHFYQWDRRWGYTTYSGAAFGLTGCGPTSMAMVYQGLTGKTDKNPYDMGKFADEGGYMSEYEGTVGTFFTETAEQLGLECEELYPDVESLKSALDHDKVVIINLAPGYFTATGHYVVATGLAKDGKAIINDPYSVERSSQTWDLDLLASQAYVMYGYEKAR